MEVKLSTAIFTVLREPEFFGRLDAACEVWEGFMNNLYLLSKSKLSQVRYMHYFEQLYGSGKSRTACELVNLLQLHYDHILDYIITKTTDQEKTNFIMPVLSAFKSASFVTTAPALDGGFHSIACSFNSQLQLGEHLYVKYEELVSQLLIRLQAKSIRCVVLNMDEMVSDPVIAVKIIRDLVTLEEKASQVGIYLQCILSGCRAKMFRINERDVNVRMKWVYLEPLNPLHVRRMWETVAKSYSRISISDTIVDYFVDKLFHKTSGWPRLVMYTFKVMMNINGNTKKSIILGKQEVDNVLDQIVPRALKCATEYSTCRMKPQNRNVLYNFYLWGKCGDPFSMRDEIHVPDRTTVADVLLELPFYWVQVEPETYKVDSPMFIQEFIEREHGEDYRFAVLSSQKPATQESERTVMLIRLLVAHVFCNTTSKNLPSVIDKHVGNEIHYKASLVMLPPVDIDSKELGNNVDELLEKPSLSPVLVQRVLEQIKFCTFAQGTSSGCSDAYLVCKETILCFAYSKQLSSVEVLQDEINKCGVQHAQGSKRYLLLVLATTICTELGKFIGSDGVLTLRGGTYHIFNDCIVRYKDFTPTQVLVNGKHIKLRTEATKSILFLHGKMYYMDIEQEMEVRVNDRPISVLQVYAKLQVVIDQFGRLLDDELYHDFLVATSDNKTARLDALTQTALSTSPVPLVRPKKRRKMDNGSRIICLTPTIEGQGPNALLRLRGTDFQVFRLLATKVINETHKKITHQEFYLPVDKVCFCTENGVKIDSNNKLAHIQHNEELFYSVNNL